MATLKLCEKTTLHIGGGVIFRSGIEYDEKDVPEYYRDKYFEPTQELPGASKENEEGDNTPKTAGTSQEQAKTEETGADEGTQVEKLTKTAIRAMKREGQEALIKEFGLDPEDYPNEEARIAIILEKEAEVLGNE